MTETLYTAAPQWAIEEAKAMFPDIEEYVLPHGEIEAAVIRHIALALAKVRADALTEAASAVESKLSELMAGNYTVLVDAYKSQLSATILALKESK
jgi:hypothetical protein